MRHMSFSLTTRQFIDGTKDVTRRVGWRNLKPGDRFMAVRKAMGLKKGEKVETLGACEVVSNTAERVIDIVARPTRGGRSEVEREGFPTMTPEQFAGMFCEHMNVTGMTSINRIEFKRIG
jgi:hypothetical protein